MMTRLARRNLLQALGASAAGIALSQRPAWAQAKMHPLDPALELAREALETIQKSVHDYECHLVKQERVGTKLGDKELMFARIRNRKEKEGRVSTPLSVYLKFEAPDSLKGQEVLWVEGKNGNKLLGHPGGTLGAFTPSLWLDPKGPIAMRGGRYPITEIGLENLVAKLIEKGERDRKHDECEVTFTDVTFDSRDCTLLEVKHPVRRSHFDFYSAKIWIDQKLRVPLRYAASSWPEPGTKEPQLLEDYAYRNLKLNVGLEDKHFDEHNKEYGFH